MCHDERAIRSTTVQKSCGAYGSEERLLGLVGAEASRKFNRREVMEGKLEPIEGTAKQRTERHS